MRIVLPKWSASVLMKNCDHFICPSWSILFLYAPHQKGLTFEKFIFELDVSSYSFKITCILISQVISLKKMVVLSAKFATLISGSPTCIPLILLIEIGKYLSCDNVLQQWEWTPLANSSHRGPFILILHWMLVNATYIMWTNLSPYCISKLLQI